MTETPAFWLILFAINLLCTLCNASCATDGERPRLLRYFHAWLMFTSSVGLTCAALKLTGVL